MKHNYSICFVVVAIAIILSGCASPARIEQMRVEGNPDQRIANTQWRKNLAIRDVTGGKETNPMWMSNVGSSEFERALEASLQAVGLLADRQSGRYVLNTHIENIDQPVIGLNFTVTAFVNYHITERSTGRTVFQKTISVPYTAGFGDSILGVERLRLANEGAIRANITRFIDDLFLLKIEDVALNN